MSGSPIYVCGITTEFKVVDTTDASICAVFYRVAELINDQRVRLNLQGILGLGNPSALPLSQVEVQRGGDDYGTSYIISNDQVKISIPISSNTIAPISSVSDCAICVSLSEWSFVFKNELLGISLRAATALGLKALAQQLDLAGNIWEGSPSTT